MHVSALFVHPVKSCAGIAVQRWPIGPRGLLWDRHWLLVDGKDRFVTQRTAPQLSRIHTELSDDALALRAPGQPPLRIALARTPGTMREVEVWGDRCRAVDAGDHAAAWVSAAAGLPLRLVRMTADFDRIVSPDYAPAGTFTDFADGFPVLVATAESLADVNARLAEPIEMRRFRPNIVVSGAAPWAEDGWQRLRIGAGGQGVELALVKPCARCAMITVDPDTGLMGREPLRTLASFRLQDGKIMFAQNALVVAPGTVAVGDPVIAA